MSSVPDTTTILSDPAAATPVAYDFYLYDLPHNHSVSLRELAHIDQQIFMVDGQGAIEMWGPKMYIARYKDRNGDWKEYQTTYFGSTVCLDEKKPLQASANAALMNEFPAGLFQQYDEYAAHSARLHTGSNFNFQCCPAAIEAFFQDHKKWSLTMEHITLHFAFYSSPGMTHASDWQWKEMMNALRHEFSLLRDIKIFVCAEFWDWARRQGRSAEALVNDAWLEGRPMPGNENFLWYLKRIAAKELRRCSQRPRQGPRVLGTTMEIVFAGVPDYDTDKEDWLVELEKYVREERSRRPWLTSDVYGPGEIAYESAQDVDIGV